METDQKKALKKLWRRLVFEAILIGGNHALMLFFVNFIIVMFLGIMEWSPDLIFPFGLVAAFFIFRRMDSELVSARDRMLEKAKAIIEQK